MINMNTEEIEKKKENTLRVLTTVYNLPSMPSIIYEVSQIIEDPMASASQLGKIISKDQGLVTKILSIANSPLYGIPRRVSTIDFAVVILGFNHIKNIVIALSMMDAFKILSSSKFKQKEFWLHSFITAVASKRLADDLGISISGEAFTAGLLHDLGIPIIYKYFPKEFNRIVDLCNKEDMSYHNAEINTLGLTHAEIAGVLIEQWNLPVSLTSVVLNHHNPSNLEQNRQLTSLVHVADFMTQKLGLANFSWDSNYELDEGVINILRLGDLDYLYEFIESYRELFETQIEIIKI